MQWYWWKQEKYHKDYDNFSYRNYEDWKQCKFEAEIQSCELAFERKEMNIYYKIQIKNMDLWYCLEIANIIAMQKEQTTDT